MNRHCKALRDLNLFEFGQIEIEEMSARRCTKSTTLKECIHVKFWNVYILFCGFHEASQAGLLLRRGW